MAINAGEAVEKREPSYTIGKVNWCGHYGKQYVSSFKSKQQLKTESPYDPPIPPLGIYLEKMKALIRKDTYTPMFITAPFITAKTWKQPKRPSTDE